jgi:hypothetical protein
MATGRLSIVSAARYIARVAGADGRRDFVDAERGAGGECHGSGRNYRGCRRVDGSGMNAAAKTSEALLPLLLHALSKGATWRRLT